MHITERGRDLVVKMKTNVYLTASRILEYNQSKFSASEAQFNVSFGLSQQLPKSHNWQFIGLIYWQTSDEIRCFKPGPKEYLTELAAPGQIPPILTSVESFSIDVSFQNGSCKTVFWARVFKVITLCDRDASKDIWKGTQPLQWCSK